MKYTLTFPDDDEAVMLAPHISIKNPGEEMNISDAVIGTVHLFGLIGEDNISPLNLEKYREEDKIILPQHTPYKQFMIKYDHYVKGVVRLSSDTDTFPQTPKTIRLVLASGKKQIVFNRFHPDPIIVENFDTGLEGVTYKYRWIKDEYLPELVVEIDNDTFYNIQQSLKNYFSDEVEDEDAVS